MLPKNCTWATRDANCIRQRHLNLRFGHRKCFILASGVCSFVLLLLLKLESNMNIQTTEILVKSNYKMTNSENSENPLILTKIFEKLDHLGEPSDIPISWTYPSENDTNFEGMEKMKLFGSPAAYKDFLYSLEKSCRFRTENHFSRRGRSVEKVLDVSTRNTKKLASGTFKERLVHFDLKGAPPKVEFFKQIFPILKKSGATGIILEYEDMFPFSGPLSAIKAKNAYCSEDIKEILLAAEILNLQVIPLVQTFGHMEFVLKISQFATYREVNFSSSALCPSNPGSLKLVTAMIDQVMNLHPKAKWLHIGCDEVFHIGVCRVCKKYHYQKDILYLNHVVRVAQYVRSKYGVTPIIWDDMIRRTSSRVLKLSRIGSMVEPMVWVYAEDVPSLFFPKMWHRYKMIFKNVWAASAYKGAFGRNLAVPNVYRHLRNHVSWLSVLKWPNFSTLNFRGLAFTGWQRYEHFGPLCELLPVGMPSLIVNLLTVLRGEYSEDIMKAAEHQLSCHRNTSVQLDKDISMRSIIGSCHFPGSTIFDLVQIFVQLNDSISGFVNHLCNISTEDKPDTWLMKYESTLALEYKNCHRAIEYVKYSAAKILLDAFDVLTAKEWTEQNLSPLSGQTRLLYDVLTGNASLKSLCQKSYPRDRTFPIVTAREQKIHQCW